MFDLSALGSTPFSADKLPIPREMTMSPPFGSTERNPSSIA
jgi:hypothetical protein